MPGRSWARSTSPASSGRVIRLSDSGHADQRRIPAVLTNTLPWVTSNVHDTPCRSALVRRTSTREGRSVHTASCSARYRRSCPRYGRRHRRGDSCHHRPPSAPQRRLHATPGSPHVPSVQPGEREGGKRVELARVNIAGGLTSTASAHPATPVGLSCVPPLDITRQTGAQGKHADQFLLLLRYRQLNHFPRRGPIPSVLVRIERPPLDARWPFLRGQPLNQSLARIADRNRRGDRKN